MTIPLPRASDSSDPEEADALIRYQDAVDEKAHREPPRTMLRRVLHLLTRRSRGDHRQGIGAAPRTPLLRSLLHVLVQCLIFLIPSFLTSLGSVFRSQKAQSTRKPLHPTAYLDGLRGVAALIVYFFHWGYICFPWLRDGYGAPDAPTTFMQRPIIRTFHSGRASVTIFFVISGYVVTLKTISMIYRGTPEKVLDSLAGAAFRRPFRLYLPIIVSTFMFLIGTRYGLFVKDPTGDGHVPYNPEATFMEQFWHWYEHTLHTMNPFRAIDGRRNLYGHAYNGHLWTIPIEFKGSMVVFTLLLACSRAKRWVHFAIVLGCIVWLTEEADLDVALFCAGMILAELSIILPPNGKGNSTSENDGPVVGGRRSWRSMTFVRHCVTISFFMFAMHVLGYPEKGGIETPGFRTLSKMVPEFYVGDETQVQWFWIAIGSVLFILALMYSPPGRFPSLLSRLSHRRKPTCQVPSEAGADVPGQQPLLQIPFTTSFAQYLGQISYSLYLFHGAVIHTVGVRYLNPAWAAWSKVEEATASLRDVGTEHEADANAILNRAWAAYVGEVAWGTFLQTIVLFWVSDVFWRGVDMKSVKATRWIAMKAWKK